MHSAAEEILKGNLVALPTETVYGLGANALNDNAVLKIYEVKNRPRFNPIIVHVKDADEFKKYSADIPEEVYKLAEKFSPGPITFVVKKNSLIPDIVTAGNDSVGLRIPSHELFREVLSTAGVPIAAPSANRFGRISPTSAEDVLKELSGKIDYILDGGRCSVGIESTVVIFTGGKAKILRSGMITKEQIEKITGRLNEENTDKIISPGMLKSHYAPVTPLYIAKDKLPPVISAERNICFLDFSKYGSMKETALNLFSDLRKADEGKYEFIVCRKVKDKGLGIAINERLDKASFGEIEFKDDQIIIKRK